MATLYLSPAEYWECANRMSKLFVQSVDELPAKGLLDKIDGYEIYLSEGVPSPNPDYWVADSILTKLGA